MVLLSVALFDVSSRDGPWLRGPMAWQRRDPTYQPRPIHLPRPRQPGSVCDGNEKGYGSKVRESTKDPGESNLGSHRVVEGEGDLPLMLQLLWTRRQPTSRQSSGQSQVVSRGRRGCGPVHGMAWHGRAGQGMKWRGQGVKRSQ